MGGGEICSSVSPDLPLLVAAQPAQPTVPAFPGALSFSGGGQPSAVGLRAEERPVLDPAKVPLAPAPRYGRRTHARHSALRRCRPPHPRGQKLQPLSARLARGHRSPLPSPPMGRREAPGRERLCGQAGGRRSASPSSRSCPRGLRPPKAPGGSCAGARRPARLPRRRAREKRGRPRLHAGPSPEAGRARRGLRFCPAVSWGRGSLAGIFSPRRPG